MRKTYDSALMGTPKNSFGIRSQTLILLRWVAVAGQTATVLFVAFILQFGLPLAACMGVIGLSAGLNLFLGTPYAKARFTGQYFTLNQLVFDLLQMAVLLGLTGGLTNPFILLLGVPVVVAITALPRRTAIALGLLTIAATILLQAFALPLPWAAGQMANIPALFICGQIIAFLTAITFIVMFVWQVTADGRRIQAALTATEAVLANETRLSALGGLAAAAAHELGTPLGTIALVAKEMSHALPVGGELAEDAQLLVEQAQRSREILSRLSTQGAENDPIYAQIRLADILEEIAAPLRKAGASIHTCTAQLTPEKSGNAIMPIMRRQPEIIYALRAFADNAADFAQSRVELCGAWDKDRVEITIRDDGPGFPEGVLKKLGEPYVTTRAGGDVRGHGGMGLGVFIGKTLIERTDGAIVFGKSSKLGGAKVQASWPRGVVEIKNQGQ